jgi:hypothetical protein
VSNLVPVRILLSLLLRCCNVSFVLVSIMQLTNSDTVVDSQQTGGCLQRTLQTLDFTDSWLQNTSLDIVSDLALEQVETVEHELTLGVTGGCVLSSIVVRSELGHEVGRVLCSVERQGLGDGKKRSSEFGNGKLFTGALKVSWVECKDSREW